MASRANQAFLWGLDVVNSGFQVLYGEPAGSEQRWKPLSVYTTDSSITSTRILAGTADQATFGIPSGAYKMATGDYRGAQDSFGNGALTLIAADVAGARSPDVRLGAAERPRSVTVIGSGRDVAAFKGQAGFNVFNPPMWLPKPVLNMLNKMWFRRAINAGGEIWLVTDPVGHQELMMSRGWNSAYINLELPMIEAVPVKQAYPVNPVPAVTR